MIIMNKLINFYEKWESLIDPLILMYVLLLYKSGYTFDWTLNLLFIVTCVLFGIRIINKILTLIIRK